MEKYLKENCGLISPEECIVGTKYIWKIKQRQHVCERTQLKAYYIPFKRTLEQLLSNKQVREMLFRNIQSSENSIKDFFDGNYFKENFGVVGVNTLYLFVYYDDVELAAVPGSKSQAYSFFYWGLANYPPELRSNLKAINLLAVAKKSVVREFGIAAVLNDFLETIKEMQTPDGIVINIGGTETRINGHLLFLMGDTPAAQLMGGFKEGVNFAHMPCRTCLITREEIQLLLSEHTFQYRNKYQHEAHVRLVTDMTLSKKDRKYNSKHSGVNSDHIFHGLEKFDITQCLLQDAMHLLAEGLLKLETKLLLEHCLESNFLDLNTLNTEIKAFEYQHLSTDKPSPISITNNEVQIHQTSSQMLCLIVILPFVLSSYVPHNDAKLLNYLLLNQINNLCLSFELHPEDVDFLSHLIDVHNTQFKKLYPDVSIPPKMHYISHLPRQIRNFGLLRHSWCMRMEAFHKQFKQTFHVVKNCINLPYTLTHRFQTKRLYELSLGNKDHNYFSTSVEVGQGKVRPLRDAPERFFYLFKESGMHVTRADSVYAAERVKCKGVEIKKDRIILIDASETLDLPVFGLVTTIYVHQDVFLVFYKRLNTTQYVPHLNAYQIVRNKNIHSEAININDLSHPQSLSAFSVNDDLFVPLMYHRRQEFCA